jgi:hypothetical protein
MAAQNHSDAHHLAVGIAEAAYQVSMKSAATELDRTNARITYYRAVLASGRLNGISTGAVQALARLGYTVGDQQAGDT